MPVLNGIETIASFTSEMLSNTKVVHLSCFHGSQTHDRRHLQVCLLSGSNLEDEGQSFLDDLGLTSFRKAPDAYRDIWQELSRLVHCLLEHYLEGGGRERGRVRAEEWRRKTLANGQ